MDFQTWQNDDSDSSRGYFSDIQFSPEFDVSPLSETLHLGDQTQNDCLLEIVEQPGDFRYRYETEKYHGYIRSESCPSTKKKDSMRFPTVKIHNYDSDVVIRCWLISTDQYYGTTAHIHKLLRKIPKGKIQSEPHDQLATRKNNYEATFDYLYIVHAVGEDKSNLKIYGEKNSWISSGNFQRPESNPEVNSELIKQIDKNQSILLFQAFDAKTKDKLCEAFSRKIKNLHNAETGVLKIVNYSLPRGSCLGGDQVYVLVEKISKDVEVRFFKLKEGSKERSWEAIAHVPPSGIHHQYAIILETPAYPDTTISEPVTVYFELHRKSDNTCSEAKPFTYQPDSHCRNNDFIRKRPHTPEPIYSELILNDVLLSSGTSQSKRVKGDIRSVFRIKKGVPAFDFIPYESPPIGFIGESAEADGPAPIVKPRPISQMQAECYMGESAEADGPTPIVIRRPIMQTEGPSDNVGTTPVVIGEAQGYMGEFGEADGYMGEFGEADALIIRHSEQPSYDLEPFQLECFDLLKNFDTDGDRTASSMRSDNYIQFYLRVIGTTKDLVGQYEACPEGNTPRVQGHSAPSPLPKLRGGYTPPAQRESDLDNLKNNVDLLSQNNNRSIFKFKCLLELRKVNLNTLDYGGNSILLLASTLSKDGVILLLRTDIDIHLKNLAGDNALLCASRAKKTDIVECLLEYGFDPNVQNIKSGETPLHIAVEWGDISMVKVLIKYGANPLLNNHASESPYDYSTYCKNIAVKKFIYLKAQEAFCRRVIHVSPSSSYFSRMSTMSTCQGFRFQNFHLGRYTKGLLLVFLPFVSTYLFRLVLNDSSLLRRL